MYVRYFMLDVDPSMSAHYHCDRDVISYIYEITKLLSHVHWATMTPMRFRLMRPPFIIYGEDGIPRPASTGIFSGYIRTYETYMYLYNMLFSLHQEYEKRYPDSIHKLKKMLSILSIVPKRLSRINSFHSKQLSEKVSEHRRIYQHRSNARWDHSEKPLWYIGYNPKKKHKKHKNRSNNTDNNTDNNTCMKLT